MPTKKNYYDILWVSQSASEAEIKKAYKKMAMKHHPDRTKGDKAAEAKFKEANEAYQTLSDVTKKKNYDQFWSAEWSPFGNAWGNPFGWTRSSGTPQGYDFWDIFSQFWWGWKGQSQTWGIEFDIGDLFGSATGRQQWWWSRARNTRKDAPIPEQTPEDNLDVTETIEIPFLDFLKESSIDVRTVYGKHLSLKVKAGTQPGTKFKISGKWRTTEGRTGNMYVIVDAKMPRFPLDPTVEKMIEAIRYQM